MALKTLTEPQLPPKRHMRSKVIIAVASGFADASGKGFGSTITIDGSLLWRSGQWKEFYKYETSNRREFENIVIALEEYNSKTGIRYVELFTFTDNMVSDNAFYRGTSSSPILFELVLRLRQLEMHGGWKLHVIHIAGKRMIQQGTDGLSRGDMMSGGMEGFDMLSFVPLGKEQMSALEASSVGSTPGGRVIHQRSGLRQKDELTFQRGKGGLFGAPHQRLPTQC
jgi:hypothetical protein